MAWIQELSGSRKQPLESEHLVGRAPTCGLCIGRRYVSAQHAILRFTGERWELRDLGSRNGTYLNGMRLKPGEDCAVNAGARIAFGKFEEQWQLTNDDPPWPMAVPLDGGEPVHLTDDMIAIPTTDNPRATIYRNSEGLWVLEQPESVAPITNLQILEMDGRSFRFSCPEYISRTSLADPSSELDLRKVALTFMVSRDEEHVEMQATIGTRSLSLGSRSHNYLLLTLARRRLADSAERLSETTCGWVYQEDLAHDPSMAPPQLNIEVFRIRKQFIGLGLGDGANIIERRPRTRQLRIGVEKLSIIGL